MLRDSYPYYLAGEAVAANTDLEVTNKYTGEVATRVALADEAAIDKAIAASVEAFPAFRQLAAYERAEILQQCVRQIEERQEELAHALAVEAGKAIIHSRIEVIRAIDTFRIAAEEATRIYGEYQPLDISPRAAGYEAVWKRVPIGPCSFISPFNFPLNLAAHKMAPALAVGCPFVLKPASSTPVSTLIFGEILANTDLPRGAFSVLPASRSASDALTTDERFKLLSFTGSPDVGWALKARAGKKKVVLELGGNAAVIVDEGTDPDYASERIIFGAFYQSGQSCIGVQRILVHESLYPLMREKLSREAGRLVEGDPLDPKTFLGPLITEKDAQRIESWVNEALDHGAKLVCGGTRRGSFYDATILENVPAELDVIRKEAFGPVAILTPFKTFKQAVQMVNDSDFGLQAGVFTQNIHRAHYAFNEIEAGGVVINDVPSMRVDSMPYGGVKDSGLGREGVRFAMEDMTEIRLMMLNRIGDASSI